MRKSMPERVVIGSIGSIGSRFFLLACLLLAFMLAAFSSHFDRQVNARSSEASTLAQGADLEIGVDHQIDNQIEVEPELLEQFENARAHGESQVGYLIYFRASADLSPALEMEWEARGQFVMDALQSTAEASQPQVRAYLESRGVEYQSFWVDNVIVVERSGRSAFDGLLAFPEIEALRARRRFEPIEPIEPVSAGVPRLSDGLTVEPNIAHVGADALWRQGITGEGIVVANIDTGVRYTHEALVNQYRGNQGAGTFDHNYSWWDSTHGSRVPSDSISHGSHTMGIMVGDDGGTNQIGMAPGAKWIACKTTELTDVELLECSQFMIAPWDLTQSNPNPAMRPHVINNSWSYCSQSYEPFYEEFIAAWHAAGIYPVFSSGNAPNCSYPEPPGLNTVSNPARYGNVTAVGSTGRSDGQYAIHSNWGPTDDPDTINPLGPPDLKPQVVAPGLDIRSAVNTDNSSYRQSGGTSMSAPHVAGLIALMWETAPCFIGDYATTENLIEQTATGIPYDDGSPTTGEGATVPNYATGWGEINALAAVDAAQKACGPTGFLAGRVTDESSVGIPNADIQATDATDNKTRLVISDEDGNYSMRLSESSTYQVTALAYGYESKTISGVSVLSGTTTTLNIALDRADFYTVEGTVRDINSGWPLYASITIEGDPVGPPNNQIWSDPETGYYSITLAADITYTLQVEAWSDGYEQVNRTVGPLTGDSIESIEDFALDVDAIACVAPGYDFDSTPIYSADFEANNGGYTHSGIQDEWEWGTPTTWPNRCASGSNCWGTDLDDDYENDANQQLLSPVIDLSGVASGTPLLASWMQAWQIEYFRYDIAFAEVSINGGDFIEMWQHNGEATEVDWTHFRADLSAAAGGTAQFRFRLSTDNSIRYPGYYIDDLSIVEANCIPKRGGLVVGNVYEPHSRDGINGASVINDSGEMTQSEETPNDSALDDGFYTLFSPPGLHVFTSTSSAEYILDIERVNVVASDTVRQDFFLEGSFLSYSPHNIEEHLEFGEVVTHTMRLTNTGPLSITYSLANRKVPFVCSAINTGFETGDLTGWTTIDGNGGWLINDGTYMRNFDDATTAPLAGRFSALAETSGPGTKILYQDIALPTDLPDRVTVSWIDQWENHSGFFLNQQEFRVELYAPDGTTLLDELFSTNRTSPLFSEPTVREVDVTALVAPYAGQRVRLQFVEQDFLYYFNVQVDSLGCQEDVPWVRTSPITGTIASSETATVEVIFDATKVFEIGDYTAELEFDGSFLNELETMPLTMHVTCPTCGFLNGQITDFDSGDSLEAQLNMTGPNDFDLTVTGKRYDIAMLPGRYDLTISADGYFSQTATITATQASTVTTDFALVPMMAKLDYAPAAISEEIQLGDVLTNSVTVTNTGYIDLEFNVRPGYELRTHGNGLTMSGSRPFHVGGTGQWLYGKQDSYKYYPKTERFIDEYNSYRRTTRSPKAYRWEPTIPSALNVLLYADDPIHPTPNTYPDQALQALGIAYTAHYDDDWAGFEANLSRGTWDMVLVAADFSPPSSFTLTALNNYVNDGGKLLFHSWAVSRNRDHALWTTLGFTWISNAVQPPAPIYWWQAGHPIFTYPERVPEFTTLDSADFRLYGQYVEPLPGFEAIAGYTADAEPNNAALIVGNDGRTLFKGFLDVQNNADLDTDGTPDGVELWTNLIVALESAFSGGGQWVSAVPDSAIVPPNSSVTFDVVFDATSLLQTGEYSAELEFNGNFVNTIESVETVETMPLTMHVTCPTCGFFTGQLSDVDRGNPIDAQINVTGPNNFDATVSGNSYQIALLPGRYDLTVSANGYFSQTTTITATQASTVTTDFALIPMIAKLDYTPATISSAMKIGDVFTNTVTVSNTGYIDLDFNVNMAGQMRSRSEFPSLADIDAYGVVINTESFTDDLSIFDPSVPDRLNAIGEIGSNHYPAADFLDGDFSTLYALDSNSNQLVAIDTATADVTIIGSANPRNGENWTGMAGDATTGKMYASSMDCQSGSTLHTIDVSTGRATEIGTISNASCIIGLAINAAGDLYGLDLNHDTLLMIDKTTAEGTEIGPIGFNAAYSQGMDFDEESGILYLAAYNGTTFRAELRIANTTTGNSALIGPLGVPGETQMTTIAVATGGESQASWVNAVPDSGTVAPNSSMTFDVVFDATSLLQIGEYRAALRFDGTFHNEVPPIDVVMDLNLTEPFSIYLPVLMR